MANKKAKTSKAPACSKGKSVCSLLCKPSDKAACPLAKGKKKVKKGKKGSLLAKFLGFFRRK